MTYAETDANGEKLTPRQILDDRIRRFSARLKDAIGEESLRSFARQAGLSDSVVHKYTHGVSYPTLDRLVAMAHAAEVNIEWLATGEGPKRAGDRQKVGESATAQSANVVDAEVLEDVLVALRARQDRLGRRFKPRNEARLVSEIYQYIIEQEQPTAEDRAKVLRLIDTIIGGTNVEPTGPQGSD